MGLSCSLPPVESTFLLILLRLLELETSLLCPAAFENAIGPIDSQGIASFRRDFLAQRLASCAESHWNSSRCHMT